MKCCLALLLILTVVGCGGDTSVRACFGSDEFCERVFAPHPPPKPDAETDQSSAAGVLFAVESAELTAIRVGLAELSAAHVPEPLQTVGSSPVDTGFMGLWLGARVLAMEMALEPEPDVLLDQLRLLGVLQDGVRWHDEPSAAARLRELGYRQLAAFSADRDPGTAELARAVTGDAAAPARDEWLGAIASGELGFVEGATAAELELAALELFAAPAELELASPAHIAAATLVLLLSLEGVGTSVRVLPAGQSDGPGCPRRSM